MICIASSDNLFKFAKLEDVENIVQLKMYLIYDNIQKIIALCQKYKVKNLYVFGSVLTDKYNDRSDIDFLLSFTPEIDYNNYSDNYFNLWESMKELLGREVDLVDEKTLRNPVLIKEIDSTKQLIYG